MPTSFLRESGWVDSDGDGIREKDGVKLAFHLDVFCRRFHASGRSHVVANQAKENMGFDITVEGVRRMTR